MKENLKEDPDWLKKEFIRFTCESDEERIKEINDELIPPLEAKMSEAGALAEGEVVNRSTTFTRGVTLLLAVGKDGLTDRERRQLRSWREELKMLQARWVDGVYTYVPPEDEADLPRLWRRDYDSSDDQMLLELRYGVREGRMLNTFFEDLREGFEAGGYVLCWNGKYYKEEECIKTPRGTWCRKEDVEKERKEFEGKRDKYKWLLDHDCMGL